MSKRKDVIHIGDKVRIINPEMVVRVGYDFTFEKAIPVVEEKYSPQILQFMESIGFNQGMFSARLKDKKLFRDIVNSIAYAVVGESFRCGNERKIYTEKQPYLTDMEFKVHHKYVVRTGQYYPSSGGYDSFSGEYDYECGGLSKPKNHIILNLTTDDEIRAYDVPKYYMAIESCNVEKL